MSTGEPEGSVHTVRALANPALGARIVRRVRMRYATGAEALHDRPAHVRAASGLAWLGDRLVVIQDDAAFVALVDPETGLAEAVTLPEGADGSRQFDDVRGNKAAKLDLEALARVPVADGVLFVAFGSGSMAPRETIVLLAFERDDAPAASRAEVVVHSAGAFYGALRRATGFAGSDMNVEGALYTQGIVRLFGRGNGAAVGGVQPLNATCDVDWAELRSHIASPLMAPSPLPQRITQYDLGSVDGLPLGFTDAAVAHGSIVFYAAAAEASADATRDGEVRGSALGVIRADAAGSARWAPLRDEGDCVFRGKIEGIALDKSDARRLFAVVDCDDHAEPSELLEVGLSGDWWS